MNQRIGAVDVHHRAPAQPVEQLVAVRRAEHIVEGIVLPPFDVALGERKQMQVMVAENDDSPLAELAHETQGRQGLGAAVDEVAHEPELVLRAVESRQREQGHQLVEATLNVADRVGGQATLPARCRCGG